MIKRITALAACIFLVAPPAFAIDKVTVSELEALPWNYADEEVQIVGEVIGDYAIQATQVWIQVNDDAYATSPLAEGGLAGTNSGIGVLISRSHFSHDWGPPGGYRVRGPIVEVTGIFRYNDGREAGGTYIEATKVEVLEESRPIAAPFSTGPLLYGIAILALVGAYAALRMRVTD